MVYEETSNPSYIKLKKKYYNMLNMIIYIYLFTIMSCGIRVITYNVLTCKYSQPSYYPTIKKEYLTEEFRWSRLQKLVTSWINAGFIICLQEVSTARNIQLAELFAQTNYTYHGYQYNDGVFGISIAFNTKSFHLLDVQCISIGRYINDLNIVIPLNSEIRSEDFKEAISQNNLMLNMLLRCRNNKHPTNFIVSTYHMPCKYLTPYVIHMHILGIRHFLNHLIEYYAVYDIKSIVLAGDMNITPSSQLYQMWGNLDHLMNDPMDGKLEEMNEINQMIHLIKENQLCKNLIELVSVFKKNGLPEPEYTNVSIQKMRVFIGTIDYILITQPITCKSCVVGLTVSDPLGSGYPNGLSPSDHLPLSASLLIQ